VEFALVQKDVLFGLQQGTKVLQTINKEMGGIARAAHLSSQGVIPGISCVGGRAVLAGDHRGRDIVQKDVLFGLQQGTKVLQTINKEMGGIEGVERLMGLL
jgi:hypothetical protein